MGAAEELPSIVYKVRDAGISDSGNGSDEFSIGYDDQPPFTEEQIDIVARALAQSRTEVSTEMQELADSFAAIRERVATIEGQLSVLMTLLGGDSKAVKTVEASEVVRKLRVS
jgi:hypothetical protein